MLFWHAAITLAVFSLMTGLALASLKTTNVVINANIKSNGGKLFLENVLFHILTVPNLYPPDFSSVFHFSMLLTKTFCMFSVTPNIILDFFNQFWGHVMCFLSFVSCHFQPSQPSSGYSVGPVSASVFFGTLFGPLATISEFPDGRTVPH